MVAFHLPPFTIHLLPFTIHHSPFTIHPSPFTLTKISEKVNIKPADPEIEKEFNKWVYAKGVKLQGLVRRRKSEAWLYFHNELKFDF